ncbi:AEC family transporter [Azospirillum sp. ST 5-10]|uniref:AEC family transporter n=1 Tax=unclassified Azospirillum TaxID=2630922 RepID=UPI003F4A4C38
MLDILTITGPIFLLIAAGYGAVRLGALSKPDVRVLGKLVVGFALPALLFRSLSQRPLAEIMNTGYLLVYAVSCLTVMALGVAVARFGKGRSLQASALYGMGMSFPNSGFVGYPVLLQVLGPPAAVVLALNMLVENVILLPLTIALAEGGRQGGGSAAAVLRSSAGRLLRNPMILAIAAGCAVSALGVVPPAPVARAVDMLASASGAVSLFAIGGALVGLEVRGLAGEIAQIAAGKLLLHPLVTVLALALLPPLEPALQVALIVGTGVPMLSIYPILGQAYGREGACAAALMATTAASFVTLNALLLAMDAGGLLAGAP